MEGGVMRKNNIDKMDIIDAQSFSSEAEGIARRFIKRHGNNFKKIEEEVLKMIAPKDFADEILWAVR
jgi:hypothetical protein